MSQITENLEIIFEKTYADGAPPDSLWDWGRSIDCAGDVNNDGYDDVIVAANRPSGDPLNPWLGKAYIFFGGEPMDTIPDVILTGSPYGTSVIHVAGVGNFNGDEYDDVVVAQDDGEQGVKVFWGGDPMDAIPDLVLETRSGLSFADDVAGAGDVNGDSLDDCILGDYSYNSLSGRALVFFGGNPPDSIPDVVLSGHDAEGMGITVGGGGDLNGDGFDDVAVGADANSEAAPFAGKVYAFFGGAVMDTVPDVWIRGEGSSQHLGWFGVDIVPHDTACAWLVAGSIFYPRGFPERAPGKLYVLYGDTIPDTLVDVHVIGQTDSSNLGRSTCSAGDVDGSGASDILSCAPQENSGYGAVYCWLATQPFDTEPDASARGEASGQELGWVTSTVGDIDRDGRDEIAFGNYGATMDSHKVWIAEHLSTAADEGPYEVNLAGAQVTGNEPNPFSTTTRVVLELARSGRGTLDIYDIQGSVVSRIHIHRSVSSHPRERRIAVPWDGTDGKGRRLPSGVYFARFSGSGAETSVAAIRKMLIIR
jgi:hypothetical protein